jgi:hypothetical protein
MGPEPSSRQPPVSTLCRPLRPVGNKAAPSLRLSNPILDASISGRCLSHVMQPSMSFAFQAAIAVPVN